MQHPQYKEILRVASFLPASVLSHLQVKPSLDANNPYTALFMATSSNLDQNCHYQSKQPYGKVVSGPFPSFCAFCSATPCTSVYCRSSKVVIVRQLIACTMQMSHLRSTCSQALGALAQVNNSLLPGWGYPPTKVRIGKLGAARQPSRFRVMQLASREKSRQIKHPRHRHPTTNRRQAPSRRRQAVDLRDRCPIVARLILIRPRIYQPPAPQFGDLGGCSSKLLSPRLVPQRTQYPRDVASVDSPYIRCCLTRISSALNAANIKTRGLGPLLINGFTSAINRFGVRVIVVGNHGALHTLETQ